MNFGKIIRRSRGTMKQEDFGNRVSYSARMIQEVEGGRSLGSPDFAVSVAKAMDKPEIMDWFCTLNCPIGQMKNCGGCASAQKKDRRSAA